MYRWIDLALAVTFFAMTVVFGTFGFPLLTLASLAATLGFAYLALRSNLRSACGICGREIHKGHTLCYWCRVRFDSK